MSQLIIVEFCWMSKAIIDSCTSLAVTRLVSVTWALREHAKKMQSTLEFGAPRRDQVCTGCDAFSQQ